MGIPSQGCISEEESGRRQPSTWQPVQAGSHAHPHRRGAPSLPPPRSTELGLGHSSSPRALISASPYLPGSDHTCAMGLVEEHVSLWGAWLSPAVTQASRRVRAAHGCEHQRAADRQSMTRNFCAARSSQHKGTQYDSRGWQCSQAQCFGGWRGALLQAARWEVQQSIMQSILDHLSMRAKELEEVRESIFCFLNAA